MTAEELVKQTYPNAIAETPMGVSTFIYDGHSLRLIGVGQAHAAAWADAASRLQPEREDEGGK